MRLLRRILISLLFISAAHADELQSTAWTDNLHLYAGAGPSSSLLQSTVERRDFGIGAHIKADISYDLSDRWSIDWSSGVDFNKVDAYLSWNTLFSFGARYRIAKDPLFGLENTYVKLFAGRSPTVIFLNGQPPPELQTHGIDRVQVDGYLYGFTTGITHQTKNGFIWYHEFTASVQTADSYDGIRMKGEVPEVVLHEKINNSSTIYGLFATFGLKVF